MTLRSLKIVRYLLLLRCMQRVNMAMARGAATRAMRHIDADDPRTWEFSGFSQNGEDGIIEYLTRHLKLPNRYFVEIGASDGIENNTTWLALAQRYPGMMIEGDSVASEWCRYWLTPLCPGLVCQNIFVSREAIAQFRQLLQHHDPDVFSVDIDGNDYYVVEALLDDGLRPKIAVVEYNSAFGPDVPLSVKYDPQFAKHEGHGHGRNLYFGCSIAAWKQIFSQHGYEFVTVDQNGVNAFFVDPQAMRESYHAPARCLEFVPNKSHAREYGTSWERQFELIRDLPLTRF